MTPTGTDTTSVDIPKEDIDEFVELLDNTFNNLPESSRFRSFFHDVSHFARTAATRAANFNVENKGNDGTDEEKGNNTPSGDGKSKFSDDFLTASRSLDKSDQFLSRLVGNCSSDERYKDLLPELLSLYLDSKQDNNNKKGNSLDASIIDLPSLQNY